MILITGAHKAFALYKAIEEGVNHMWTVSAFQQHPHTIFVCDEDATLELRVKTVKYFKGTGTSCLCKWGGRCLYIGFFLGSWRALYTRRNISDFILSLEKLKLDFLISPCNSHQNCFCSFRLAKGFRFKLFSFMISNNSNTPALM